MPQLKILQKFALDLAKGDAIKDMTQAGGKGMSEGYSFIALISKATHSSRTNKDEDLQLVSEALAQSMKTSAEPSKGNTPISSTRLEGQLMMGQAAASAIGHGNASIMANKNIFTESKNLEVRKKLINNYLKFFEQFSGRNAPPQDWLEKMSANEKTIIKTFGFYAKSAF